MQRGTSEKALERAPAPVINSLLVLSGLAFLILFAAPEPVLQHCALWPLGQDFSGHLPRGLPAGEFRPWQPLTYAFLHGGVFGAQAGVANFAHLAGIVFGLVFILLFDRGERPPAGP